MKQCNILCLSGKDSDVLGRQIADLLHIPFFAVVRPKNFDFSDEGFAEECRTITRILDESKRKFIVIATGERTCDYLPSALILTTRTTLCTLGDDNIFADLEFPCDATPKEVIGSWLSPEILASFSGNP